MSTEKTETEQIEQSELFVEELEINAQLNLFKQSPIMHDELGINDEVNTAELFQIDWKSDDEDTKTEPPPVRVRKRNPSRNEEITNKCEICSKTFSTKANMLRHVREHQGRRFICHYDKCNSFFTQRSSLKFHLQRHKREKPFTCFLCDKSFAQHKSLTFHLRIHTGERPFTCDYCDKSFNQKSNLIRHFKCHRKPSRPKDFQCTNCENWFASKQSLCRHFLKHHGEECKVIIRKKVNNGQERKILINNDARQPKRQPRHKIEECNIVIKHESNHSEQDGEESKFIIESKS